MSEVVCSPQMSNALPTETTWYVLTWNSNLFRLLQIGYNAFTITKDWDRMLLPRPFEFHLIAFVSVLFRMKTERWQNFTLISNKSVFVTTSSIVLDLCSTPTGRKIKYQISYKFDIVKNMFSQLSHIRNRPSDNARFYRSRFVIEFRIMFSKFKILPNVKNGWQYFKM